MSNIYKYYVSDETNILDKINDMTVRINIDPQITSVLNMITFSTPNLSIDFASPLNDVELIIVNKMENIIFNGAVPGETIFYNNCLTNQRSLISVDTIPTVEYDIYGGYNVGSIIYNNITSTLYQCVSGATGSANWLQLNNELCYCNAVRNGASGTINISTSGTGTNIPCTNILSESGGFTLTTTGDVGSIICPKTGTFHVNYTVTIDFQGALITIGSVSTVLKLNGTIIDGTQCTISNILNNSTQAIVSNFVIISMTENDIISISALSTNVTNIVVSDDNGLFATTAAVATITINQL